MVRRGQCWTSVYTKLFKRLWDRVRQREFVDLVTTIESLPGPQRIGVLIDRMRRKVRTSLPLGQIEKLE